MKQVERFNGLVYASDYDALLAERDELLAALADIAETDVSKTDSSVLYYIIVAQQHKARAIIAKCRGDV